MLYSIHLVETETVVMKKLLSILFALAAFASCTFKQDVTFNKNWSGSMSCVADMREMSTLLESSGDPMDFMEETDSKNKIKQLKETPGIKKVKVQETEKGVYKITYTFKNLEALNKSGNILFSDEKLPQDFTYFELKNPNTLYFTMPFTGGGSSEEDMSTENSIGENFIYELTLSFPKRIKTLETKTSAILSSDQKRVVFKTDMMTLTSGLEPGMLIIFE